VDILNYLSLKFESVWFHAWISSSFFCSILYVLIWVLILGPAFIPTAIQSAVLSRTVTFYSYDLWQWNQYKKIKINNRHFFSVFKILMFSVFFLFENILKYFLFLIIIFEIIFYKFLSFNNTLNIFFLIFDNNTLIFV